MKSKTQGRKFAEGTSVPVVASQAEIRKLVLSHGATGWAVIEDGSRVCLQFRLLDRVIRFGIDMNDAHGKAVAEPEQRRRWRALLLAIKAKLTIAQDGIETFDSVFLANIVTNTGETVGEWAAPQVEKMIASGRPLALIPAKTN